MSMKSYLRFEPGKTFGLIASPQCNITYDWSGNLALTGAVQDIFVWNLRQAIHISTIKNESSNYPYTLPGEVNVLHRCPNKNTLAAGYSNGEIKISDYITNEVKATLRAHRSAVSALQSDGKNYLASGGRDTDIFIWDLVSFTLQCRLRGHQEAITGLAFLTINNDNSSSNRSLIVSSSKDTLVKVWELSTQVCLQTITGHRCEIWSLALSPDGRTLVTGASDDVLRGYSIKEEGKEGETLPYLEDEDECFRVRSETEISKKIKRRIKRAKDKEIEKSEAGEAEGGGANAVDDQTSTAAAAAAAASSEDSEPTLSDVLDTLPALRCGHRVKSLCFSPAATGATGKKVLKAKAASPVSFMVSLLDNSIETYQITLPASAAATNTPKTVTPPVKTAVLDLHGHRSDVRAVSLSSNGLLAATCSSEGVRVWNTTTCHCLRSCRTGYGVSIVFAPGDRYILLGTKEGHLQAVDSSTGELSLEVAAAHEGPLWTLAVRPDGKGIMTGGADKYVKFWDFTIEGGKLGLEVTRQLLMSHDILTVCYSGSRLQAKLLLAVGLLDHTIKVFYDDSLKFFLSLYGHKLPVTSIAICSDASLLASGSADKTIKVWGLDFGDCHRSLLGHEDTVTCVRWQPDTHLLFSCCKAGMIKYWDADRFELVLQLPGHSGPVWGLEVSYDCSFLASCGADRSIRLWSRGEDLVFVSEEKERYLEAQAEVALAAQSKGNTVTATMSGDNTITTTTTLLTLPSVETIKSTERLMDVLESIEREIEMNPVSDAADPPSSALAMSISQESLLGLRKLLRSIKVPDIEAALIELPLHLISVFLRCLIELSKSAIDIELSSRSSLFLLGIHKEQIHVRTSLRSEIESLQQQLRGRLTSYRRLIGSNVAGLKYLQRLVDRQQENRLKVGQDTLTPLTKKPVTVAATAQNKSNRGKKRKISQRSAADIAMDQF